MEYVKLFTDYLLFPFITFVLSVYGAKLLAAASKWFNRKAAESRFLAKLSILFEAAEFILPRYLDKIKDGTFDDQDRKVLLAELLGYCKPKIEKLAHESWDEFVVWAEDKVDVLVGKLKRGVGLDSILPTDQATAPSESA